MLTQPETTNESTVPFNDLKSIQIALEQEPVNQELSLGRPYKAVNKKRKALGIRNTAGVQPRWSKSEDKLLGTATDKAIARRLKRTKISVTLSRERLGVPAFQPCLRWTKKEDKFLGSRIDEEIARQLKRTLSSVCARRHALRIEAYAPCRL